MYEIKKSACANPLMSLRLRGFFLLVAWSVLVPTAQSKEVVYTAKDLKLENYFSGAVASYRFQSTDKYEALVILGQMNEEKRSGQDAFYWPPALSILIGCSLKKLGSHLGYKQINVLMSDGGRVDALNPDAGDKAEVQFVSPTYALTPEDIKHSRKLLNFDSPEAKVFDQLCLNGMK